LKRASALDLGSSLRLWFSLLHLVGFRDSLETCLSIGVEFVLVLTQILKSKQLTITEPLSKLNHYLNETWPDTNSPSVNIQTLPRYIFCVKSIFFVAIAELQFIFLKKNVLQQNLASHSPGIFTTQSIFTTQNIFTTQFLESHYPSISTT